MEDNRYSVRCIGSSKGLNEVDIDVIRDVINEVYTVNFEALIETIDTSDRCRLEKKVSDEIRERLHSNTDICQDSERRWNVIVGSSFSYSGELLDARYIGYTSKYFNIFIFHI